MINILYFDHWQSASEFYRTMPLDYINNPEITITRSTERDIKSHLLNRYDVIFLLRPTSESHLNIIKLAKDLHKVVIGDYDDDPLHLPETNPMYGTYQGDKPHAIKCLALCDEIWAATDGIKKSFRLYNKNIHVINNAHDDYIFKVEDKKVFKYNKKAMYRGGGSHMGDIYEPGVTEWILKLINGNKKWQFLWLGQRFEWLEYRVKHGNMFYSTGGATIQFYKMMHELNPCAFMYPLANNIFNQSKSNCSWLESTYAGAAYFGNTDLPEFNNVGTLPLSQMPYLMKQEEVLRSANETSWEYISDTLLLSKVNETRLNRLLTYIK